MDLDAPARGGFPDVSASYRKFLAGLPKAELHLHIEGTLTPELKWQLAGRNKIALPYSSIEEMRAAQAFEAPDAPSYLKKFIQHYNEGMAVLRTAPSVVSVMRPAMPSKVDTIMIFPNLQRFRLFSTAGKRLSPFYGSHRSLCAWIHLGGQT